jgi:hypothetical protein
MMMKKPMIFFLIILLTGISLISCERDDICPPGTPTTPKIIIEFFDVENSEENKPVPQLSYVAGDSQDTLIFNGQVDSIALPLNTNANTTKFKLIRNTGDAAFENADDIEFTYEVNEKYINRACSFKAIYNDLSATRIPENPLTNNWIRSISVEELDVENEQVTHVFILH